MDDLLGIGGESIVIKFKTQSGMIAIKIIPLKDSDPKMKTSVQNEQNIFKTSKIPKKNLMNKVRLKLGMKQKTKKIELDSNEGLREIIESEKESGNILKNEAEFECSSIQHPNIIGYLNVSLDIVNEEVALLAGKYF